LILSMLCPATTALAAQADGATPARPNVLCIITDQQHAGMLSCAGNRYLKTPAMDRIARRGVRFERAYASNPACLPSRFSMMTGYYPSLIGVGHNGDGRKGADEKYIRNSMGWVFRNAGYATAYGGKVHLPRGMSPQSMGFDVITGDQRGGLTDAGAAYLRREHSQPFLLVLSFINPHDICYMAIQDLGLEKRGKLPPLAEALRMPEGVSREEFFRNHCPPLPENYEPQPEEPEIITTGLFQRQFKRYVRENWPDERWRLHRWAYCRLTEMVDAKIAAVLSALDEAGFTENTLIVFTSDHGDMDAAHRLEHKTVLYEESVRVPLLVSCPGVVPPGRVDDEHPVSAGLDLLPTICDFAGVEPPKGLPGRSIRPLCEGRPVESWRDALVVESEFGRLLRTARYKYTIYKSGRHREQLIDVQADPGEMTNLAGSAEHREILRDHRARLAEHVKRSGDRIAAEYVVGAP